MPNISKDKMDLETLIYGSQAPKKNENAGGNDLIDSEGDAVEVDPLFIVDYATDIKSLRRKAYKTVMTMAKHMLPEDMIEDEYVKNKIEQDIDTLSELYYMRKSNTDIKISIMDSISKGNIAPRMFDSYKAINDSIAENNKQIIATEDNLRKTYTDLKYEVQSKRAELEGSKSTLETMGIIGEPKKPSALPKGGMTFTGSKGMIAMAKNKKRQDYLEANAVDVEFK